MYSISNVLTGNCMVKNYLVGDSNNFGSGRYYTYIVNNDNDCQPASSESCCGNKKQWISLEWP